MKRIKVLIADDSVVYRAHIRAALADLHSVEVVGVAANGKIALERLKESEVDLFILDLEMPVLDGLQTLRELSQLKFSGKVLMFASNTKRSADITLEALRLGASDFIAKPGNPLGEPLSVNLVNPSILIQNLLKPKIAALFPLDQAPAVESPSSYPNVIWELFNPGILVIGASTGGPSMLEKIFSELSLPLRCPVVIVQHMPPIFTASLAERLERLSGIRTKEAVHGEKLEKDTVYIAPGNYHVRLAGTRLHTTLELSQDSPVHFVRPAVDPLFETAAKIFRDKCLGLVLTGMGADGKLGAESIKNHNGCVAIQDQKSCVVFGMPGAVKASGAYDKILTPDEIISELQRKVAAPKTKPTLRVGGER